MRVLKISRVRSWKKRKDRKNRKNRKEADLIALQEEEKDLAESFEPANLDLGLEAAAQRGNEAEEGALVLRRVQGAEEVQELPHQVGRLLHEGTVLFVLWGSEERRGEELDGGG